MRALWFKAVSEKHLSAKVRVSDFYSNERGVGNRRWPPVFFLSSAIS